MLLLFFVIFASDDLAKTELTEKPQEAEYIDS